MEEAHHELSTIRIAYVTSPREIATEGVGTDPRITPTLEYLQREIAAGNPLVKNVVIAAVLVDDNGTARCRHENENPSEAFEYLRAFCEQHGMAFRMEESKPWRQIPSKIEQDGVNVPNPAKHEEKAQYEKRMLAFMRENNIDVILSDSYTVLFDSVMLDQKHGYNGLIINIHPGIASEVPGVTPTKDAFARSNLFTHYGADKHEAFSALAAGKDLWLRRNGHDSTIERVFGRMGADYSFDGEHVLIPCDQRNVARAVTGATLHVVDEFIDHGRTITFSSGTPIRKGDDVKSLRVRNYPTKNNVAVRGLGLYIREAETQVLISENRLKNRAFNMYNMSSLPNYGSTDAFGRVPAMKIAVPLKTLPPLQIIGVSNGKKQ